MDKLQTLQKILPLSAVYANMLENLVTEQNYKHRGGKDLGKLAS